MTAPGASFWPFFRKFLCILVVTFLWNLPTQAQNEKVEVRQIKVTGSKRTLPNTILREVYFHSGDSLLLRNLTKTFEYCRTRILSTGLAIDVKINLKNWNVEDAYTDVEITIKEAQYFYPIPTLQLADRNFNIWFKEQKASLSRLNIGLYNFWLNPTGRAEVYKIGILTGYTNRLDLSMYYPALNTSRTFGMILGSNLANSKEIGYQTLADRLVFKRLEEPALKKAKVYGGVQYRPKTYATHQLQVIYQYWGTSDSIAKHYNPNLLGSAKTKLSFYSVRYGLDLDTRNLRVYATEGYAISGNLQKDGILPRDEINRITLSLGVERYWSLGYNTFIDTKNKIQINHYFDSRIPYLTNRGLGYERDYLRGYEYYVVDGQNFGYSKVNFKYLLFEKNINLGRYMPITKLRTMPVRLFWGIHSDLGYVQNQVSEASNILQNKLLYGFGSGINILLYHNKLIQIEWSLNHLFEKSLFLHYDIGF